MDETKQLQKMTAKLTILRVLGVLHPSIYEQLQATVVAAQMAWELGKGKDSIPGFIKKNTQLLDGAIEMIRESVSNAPGSDALMDGLLDPEKTFEDAVGDCVSDLTPEQYDQMQKVMPDFVLKQLGLKAPKEKLH